MLETPESWRALGTSCPDHFLRTKIRPLVVPFDAAPAMSTGDRRSRRGDRRLPRRLRRLLRALQAARQPADARSEPGRLPGPGRRHDHLRPRQDHRADRRRVLRQRHQRHARRDRGEPVRRPAEQEAFDIEYWLLEEAKLQRVPKPKPLAGRVACHRRRRRHRQGDRAPSGARAPRWCSPTSTPKRSSRRGRVRRGFREGRGARGQCDVTDEAAVARSSSVRSRARRRRHPRLERRHRPPRRRSRTRRSRSGTRTSTCSPPAISCAARRSLAQGAEVGRQHRLRRPEERARRLPGAAAYCAAKAAECTWRAASRWRVPAPASASTSSIPTRCSAARGSGAAIGARSARAPTRSPRALEEHYRERSLLKHNVLPEDIAEAVLFFASDCRPSRPATSSTSTPATRKRSRAEWRKRMEARRPIDTSLIAEKNQALASDSKATMPPSAKDSPAAASTSRRSPRACSASRGRAQLGRRHRRHPLRPLPGRRRAAQHPREARRLRGHPAAGPRHAARLAALPVGQAARRGRASPARRSLGSASTPSTPTPSRISRASARYKFGSLTHTDPAVRRQAVEHNLECIEIGKKLGSKALTVWIGDGGNFPGQQHFAAPSTATSRALRADLRGASGRLALLLEHKLYEPAFYSTVICDWGTSYIAPPQLGRRPVPGRSRPPCAERQHRDDRRPAHPVRQARRLPLQRQQIRRRRPRHRLDQPVPAFLIFNELVDAAARKAPSSTRPTCSTSRTTSPTRSRA